MNLHVVHGNRDLQFVVAGNGYNGYNGGEGEEEEEVSDWYGVSDWRGYAATDTRSEDHGVASNWLQGRTQLHAKKFCNIILRWRLSACCYLALLVPGFVAVLCTARNGSHTLFQRPQARSCNATMAPQSVLSVPFGSLAASCQACHGKFAIKRQQQ